VLNPRTKRLLNRYVIQITDLTLKVGVLAGSVAAAYLLYLVIGGKIEDIARMKPHDAAYLASSIGWAIIGMNVGAYLVVGSLVARKFSDEQLGQTLTIIGVVLFFGGTAYFAHSASASVRGNAYFVDVVNAFRHLGVTTMLPGLVLVLRDAIIGIWNGFSAKRVVLRRYGDLTQKMKSYPKLYTHCWDTPFCQKQYLTKCPALTSHKNCWHLKSGCYCDENVILAEMAKGAPSERLREITHSFSRDGNLLSLSPRQKRLRCRRCLIYGDHQRHKYHVLSTFVFPVALIAYWINYGRLSGVVYSGLEKADRFMSFITHGFKTADYSFAQDGHLITTVAMMWLLLVAVSYSLRALEYLVFDLQV